MKGTAAAVVERYPERFELLFEMLQHRRPHRGSTEKEFIERYLMKYRPYQDEKGNLFVKIEGKGDDILWSSHTDSVHHHDGMQGIFINKRGIVSLDKTFIDSARFNCEKGKSNCLGADDGAGVWIMTQMIEAGKPGLYIFHRGEEKGAIGSHFIANEYPEILEGIKAAIAFDRFGYRSVITHQGGRTASDEFAASLAAALPNLPELKPDSGGLFTDTKCYADLVGECTNLSVGYFRQHSSDECLDIHFLDQLRLDIIALDTDALVFKRKPGERDVWNGRTYWAGHGGTNTVESKPKETTKVGESKEQASTDTPEPLSLPGIEDTETFPESLGTNEQDDLYDGGVSSEEAQEEYDKRIADMAEAIAEDPIGTAILLFDYGVDLEELLGELQLSDGLWAKVKKES